MTQATVAETEGGRRLRPGWWRPGAWIVIVGLFALPPVPALPAAGVVLVGALAALTAERLTDPRWRLGLVGVTALSGVGATLLSPHIGFGPLPIFIAAVSLARLVPWRRTVVVSGLVLGVLFALAVLYVSGTPWGLISGVGVPLVAARSWDREALRREHARTVALLAELEQRRDADLRAAAADERARIARDLHDVLAHTLSGLSLQLQGVRAVLARHPDTPESVTSSLDRAAQLARDGLDEAKRAVAALRADPAPGAAQLARLVAEHPGARLEVGDGFDELDTAVRETVLATVRESLTNVRRHAPGAAVAVVVDTGGDTGGDTGAGGVGAGGVGSGAVTVAVDDDGAREPVTASGHGGGMGLRGLAERAALVGGTVDARARARGWSVRLSVPAP